MLAAVAQRGGHHLHGHGGLLQPIEREPFFHDLAEPRAGVDRVALLQVEPGAVEAALRIDVLAAEPEPDLRHALHPGRRGVTGESDTVDRPYRGSIDPIGHEAVVGQHLEHPDLDRPTRAPAGQHQCGELGFGLLLGTFLRGKPSRPRCGGSSHGEADDQHDQDQRDHDEQGEHDGEGRDGGVGPHRCRGYRAQRRPPVHESHTRRPHCRHASDGRRPPCRDPTGGRGSLSLDLGQPRRKQVPARGDRMRPGMVPPVEAFGRPCAPRAAAGHRTPPAEGRSRVRVPAPLPSRR